MRLVTHVFRRGAIYTWRWRIPQDSRILRKNSYFQISLRTNDPNVGEVRIACSSSFVQLLYPQLLALMSEEPRLLVYLEAAPQDTVVSGVLDGRFDLGIVGQDTGHPRLNAQSIGRKELCLILPGDAADETVTFEPLEDRGFVAHPDGFAYADDLLSLNFPETFMGADRLTVRTFVNQIGQIPSPVANGIGYTLLPRSGIEAFSERDRLKVVALPHRHYHDLWSIIRRRPEPTARLCTIMQVAHDVAGEIGLRLKSPILILRQAVRELSRSSGAFSAGNRPLRSA